MKRTLFRGGAVFDGTGTTPELVDVAVQGARVVAVGAALDGDVEVDVTGSTLLPGLFDCHVHVTSSTLDLARRLHTPFSYSLFQAARNLEALLALGITTIRDAGGADFGIKQAVDHALICGPRLHVSLTMISQTGGHADQWAPCGIDLRRRNHPSLPDAIVDGPDEMRKKVRELVRNGADWIKVATSAGVLSAHGDPRLVHFSEEELAMLGAEARAARRPFMAHAHSTEGIQTAIRAGARSIEHGTHLDDETIALMVERGTWLVPTLLAPLGILAAAENGAFFPPSTVESCQTVMQTHASSFARAVDAGVKIAMGSDCPSSPHGTNLQELDLMVRYSDMTPLAALHATTLSAAALLGVDGELGTLEPGKIADVVVIDGGIDELSTLPQRVRQVWKDGERIVDQPRP